MSIFSKIVRGITGAGAGFLAGGPLGAVIGGASAFLPQGKVQPGTLTPQPAASFLPGGVPGFSATPVLSRVPPLLKQIPRLLPIPLPLPGFGGGAAGAGGACPSGFHLDKRTRSKCVRNRRMNPLNGRAATRAIRRIKGARKMLQKIERQLPKTKGRRTPAHGHRVSVEAT